MCKKILITTLFSLALCFSLKAQDDDQQPQEPLNTIDQQFTDLMNASNNYQEYKVVKKAGLQRFINNTRDSINSFKNEIEGYRNELRSEKAQVEKLNANLTQTQDSLNTTRAKIDSIDFLGIPMEKSGYKGLMWGIVAILAIALIFFILRFRGSNVHTKEARRKQAETEQEFDDFRKKSLEKQQELGRQLQDERNKAIRNSKG